MDTNIKVLIEIDCPECKGHGVLSGNEKCFNCNGKGCVQEAINLLKLKSLLEGGSL